MDEQTDILIVGHGWAKREKGSTKKKGILGWPSANKERGKTDAGKIYIYITVLDLL